MRCPLPYRHRCPTPIGERYGTVLLLVIAVLWTGWPRPGVAEARPGALVLVGGVLPFNQGNVWRRIVGYAADLVIVPAAGDRPKLYGDFARRALERHGAFAEVLPLAADPAEFGADHRRATADRALIEKVREAGGVFFVGGAPQRLAEVLFRPDGVPTPMAEAVAEAYASGAVVVGGIPGSVGLYTGIDALEVLARGRVPPAYLHRGLGLVGNGWFVDQHVFTAGRLAEVLVAMHQLGATRGLGIGADTAAVVEDGQVEVVGDGGVLLIDRSGRGSDRTGNEPGLSESPSGPSGSRPELSRSRLDSPAGRLDPTRSRPEPSASRAALSTTGGFRLAGARVSYLEHGDRFDLATLEVTPAAAKLDGFRIAPAEEGPPPSEAQPMVGDLFARGQVRQLLRDALDGSAREAFGFAYSEDATGGGGGHRFRFHATADTVGWVSVESGTERHTIVNIGLDVAPVARQVMPEP